ncbi:hypothetical protein SDC9_175280 [bioreactor metagenome]|uniref:Uncharacterized protein n=1 Tax=bioreactor metagenome TaxID=1076179 RepID=A0A645GNT8_9ZZZZ
MAIDYVCLNLHKLHIHAIVNAGSVTVEVGTGTYHGTLLAEIVEAYVVGIVESSTGDIDVVILADTCLECFVEPVGVHHTGIDILFTGRIVSCRNIHATVVIRHGDVRSILAGIHHIIHATVYLIDTHVAAVINLHGFVAGALLRGDDHHPIGGT